MKKLFLISVILLTISSVKAQTAGVPIFDMKSGGLLGGVSKGIFVNSKTASMAVKDNNKLVHYSFDGAEINEITVNNFRFIEVCSAYTFLESARTNSGFAVGKNISWNLFPQRSEKIDLNNKTYTKIVADFLKTKGFTNANVNIKQAVSVDLDGDGKKEVVIAATQETGESGVGYSFVLVRKIAENSVRSILIDGEFYPESKRAASNALEVAYFEISAIADLNGDGKMEIMVNSSNTYYDGGSAKVFKIDSVKATPIRSLVTDCGFF